VVPPDVVASTEYESILDIAGNTMTIDRYTEIETGDCLVNIIQFEDTEIKTYDNDNVLVDTLIDDTA
jgi:hypothetical protein